MKKSLQIFRNVMFSVDGDEAEPIFVSAAMSEDRQKKSGNGLRSWNGSMELKTVEAAEISILRQNRILRFWQLKNN